MAYYNRIFIGALACLFSITIFAADLPGNPADDDVYQSAQRFKEHFQKQDAYQRRVDDLKASIGKDSQNRQTIQQIINKAAVMPDGSKAELKTVVTQIPDKAKVASTLTERLKNAKSYATNLGKASIPSFVGMAAFHSLMEGIDYVMGEGGQVTKKDENAVDPTSLSCSQHSCNYAPSLFRVANYEYLGNFSSVESAVRAACSAKYFTSCTTIRNDGDGYSMYVPEFGTYARVGGVAVHSNPDYVLGTETPETVPIIVSDDELQTALKNALESNNPALAAAIADAIKSAYSFDGSEGQKTSSNTLAKEAADDMAVALPKAFDNPVPTSNPERPSGYYKITDGDKTVEGYVTPAPISGTSEYTTTPVLDPVTGQPTGATTTTGGSNWPPLCDYAAKFCDWMDWTQEEPDLPEEDGDIPNEILPAVWTPFELVNFDATCPPDIPLTMQIIGSPVDSIFPMQPFCTFFSGMQPFVLLLSMILSVKIVAGSLNNTVF